IQPVERRSRGGDGVMGPGISFGLRHIAGVRFAVSPSIFFSLGHFGTFWDTPRSARALGSTLTFFRGAISCHFVPFCAPTVTVPTALGLPGWSVTKPAGGWRPRHVGGGAAASAVCAHRLPMRRGSGVPRPE